MTPRARPYRFSPRAIADLEGIWRYTARTWSPDQADRYHTQIIDVLDRLAAGHTPGRACDDIRRGYFKLTAISHTIFYRERPGHIEIVYRPSEILLMLQGRERSDEWTVGRQHQEMDGEAEIRARH